MLFRNLGNFDIKFVIFSRVRKTINISAGKIKINEIAPIYHVLQVFEKVELQTERKTIFPVFNTVQFDMK